MTYSRTSLSVTLRSEPAGRASKDDESNSRASGVKRFSDHAFDYFSIATMPSLSSIRMSRSGSGFGVVRSFGP